MRRCSSTARPHRPRLGPDLLHLAGRAVFFLWVTLALLAISGIAVLCPGSAS
jgi:hypothetical protein